MLRSPALAVALVGLSALGCSPLVPKRIPPSAIPRGRIVATLSPAQGIKPKGPELVTFGLPLPRGSLEPSDLSTVRVLQGGVEIPAHVDMLAPYRDIGDPEEDGRWVRVARIQLVVSFTEKSSEREPLTVEWGFSPREADVQRFIDPRKGWHPVSYGSFAAEDYVVEPNIYVVLPKDLLAQGVLRTRLAPLDDRVGEALDPPARLRDERLAWPLAYDIAQKNFFYGLLNEPSGTNPYRTRGENNGEAWLFDRASAMFVFYMRSGSPRVLSEAVRAAVFYEHLLLILRQKDGDPSMDPRDEGAFFSWRKPLSNPRDAAMEPLWDPKYSYAECLAYTHWLTGDERILDKLDAVIGAFSDVPSRWSPDLAPIRKSTGEPLREAWTERNVAFKLLAATIGFEITGKEKYRALVERIVEDLLWHQAQGPDGGLYHFGTQHDRDEAGRELIASPWMSALLVDAMVRVYSIWQDPRIAHFIARMGNMLASASKVHARPDGKHVRYPDYLVRPDGSTHTDLDGIAHAADVMGALAWAHSFKTNVLREPGPAFREIIVGSPGLYEAFVEDISHDRQDWVLRPYRRYAWMFRTSGALFDLIRGP